MNTATAPTLNPVTVRTATCVGTFSGGFVDLANPRPEQIHFEDVASGLAREGRFTNQAHPRHQTYSVAQHVCLVTILLEQMGANPETAHKGLHHDDHEFITGDISTPLKLLLPTIRPIQERIQQAIHQALDIPPVTDGEAEIIKQADHMAFVIEAQLLMKNSQQWNLQPLSAAIIDQIAKKVIGRIWSPMAAYSHYKSADRLLRVGGRLSSVFRVLE